jgi:hypothetical protein
LVKRFYPFNGYLHENRFPPHPIQHELPSGLKNRFPFRHFVPDSEMMETVLMAYLHGTVILTVLDATAASDTAQK